MNILVFGNDNFFHKVCFVLELAIDQGGPRRRHLAEEVAMKYFIGDEGKFFLTNAVAIEV